MGKNKGIMWMETGRFQKKLLEFIFLILGGNVKKEYPVCGMQKTMFF
jgi:hypothetical protein